MKFFALFFPIWMIGLVLGCLNTEQGGLFALVFVILWTMTGIANGLLFVRELKRYINQQIDARGERPDARFVLHVSESLGTDPQAPAC